MKIQYGSSQIAKELRKSKRRYWIFEDNNVIIYLYIPPNSYSINSESVTFNSPAKYIAISINNFEIWRSGTTFFIGGGVYESFIPITKNKFEFVDILYKKYKI